MSSKISHPALPPSLDRPSAPPPFTLAFVPAERPPVVPPVVSPAAGQDSPAVAPAPGSGVPGKGASPGAGVGGAQGSGVSGSGVSGSGVSGSGASGSGVSGSGGGGVAGAGGDAQAWARDLAKRGLPVEVTSGVLSGPDGAFARGVIAGASVNPALTGANARGEIWFGPSGHVAAPSDAMIAALERVEKGRRGDPLTPAEWRDHAAFLKAYPGGRSPANPSAPGLTPVMPDFALLALTPLPAGVPDAFFKEMRSSKPFTPPYSQEAANVLGSAPLVDFAQRVSKGDAAELDRLTRNAPPALGVYARLTLAQTGSMDMVRAVLERGEAGLPLGPLPDGGDLPKGEMFKSARAFLDWRTSPGAPPWPGLSGEKAWQVAQTWIDRKDAPADIVAAAKALLGGVVATDQPGANRRIDLPTQTALPGGDDVARVAQETGLSAQEIARVQREQGVSAQDAANILKSRIFGRWAGTGGAMGGAPPRPPGTGAAGTQAPDPDDLTPQQVAQNIRAADPDVVKKWWNGLSDSQRAELPADILRAVESIAGADFVRRTEAPRLLAAAEKAAGGLSVDLGMNVNPSLRRVLADSRSGTTPLPAYPTSLTDDQATAAAANALRQNGMGREAEKAAPEIAKLAKAIDADPTALARAIARDVTGVRQAASAISPQNPILVDGARDPASVGRATEAMSALMSQATPKAEGWRTVTLDGGSQVDLYFEPEVSQTRVMSDIDGVFAPSYGVKAFDVAVTLPGGRTGHVFLKLDQSPGGEIATIHGLTYKPGTATAQVEADVKSSETGRTERRKIDVPVSPEQAKILAQAQSTAATNVEGLGARYFPPSSLNFLKLASKNAEGGNRAQGAIDLPEVALNTFGTALDPSNPKAFRGSPAQLVTSIARSLGFEETIEPVPDGFYAIPGIKVYSGGSAITQGSRLSEPFGLSPEQAQGFQNVAKSIRPLVDEFSDSWGLSPAARKAWQDAVFANPDIPSVILPASVVEELKHRTQASHPLRTLADLQRQLDERLNTIVEQNGLDRVITLHHTPTGSSPGKPDDVAYHNPAQPNAPFTTEWQFAVNGQKALPVLDDVIAKLERDHGFDLKAALEAQGYSYGRIREMSLEQTIALFRDVVRPMITARGPNLLGTVVIGVDTYAEKNGRPGGSDASMIRAAEALYGTPNVVVVQVDTFSGNPGAAGRNPAFSMGLNGQNRHEETNPSDDPDGPNGAIAPSFYVTRPEEFGRVMNGALSDQSPLTPEEWRVRRQAGGANTPGNR